VFARILDILTAQGHRSKTAQVPGGLHHFIKNRPEHRRFREIVLCFKVLNGA